MNQKLKKHIQKIIDKELAQEYRSEAMRILKKAKRHEVAEFLITHYSDDSGVGLIGTCLDIIKIRLAKDGEIGKNFGKKFGLENYENFEL